MRTNIEIDDALLREAMRYSLERTKRAIVNEALRTFVEVKAREARSASYARRVEELASRVSGLHLREPPHEVLRSDRESR